LIFAHGCATLSLGVAFAYGESPETFRQERIW
jgi:hypothetical protein